MHYRTAVEKIAAAQNRRGGFSAAFGAVNNDFDITSQRGRQLFLDRSRAMYLSGGNIDPETRAEFDQDFGVSMLLLVVFAWGCITDDVPLREKDLGASEPEDLAAAIQHLLDEAVRDQLDLGEM